MNAENKTKSISTLLKNKQSPLASLYKKGLSIRDLDVNLKVHLDQTLTKHFELANINKDSVILLANSSAWATRLRYNIPTILNVLHNQLNLTSIKSVRIKIKKSLLDYSIKNKKTFSLSNKSAIFLKNAADNFKDPQIRKQILKLSKHTP